MLTAQDLERYRKQLLLPTWDEAKQVRLQESSVLVVGAGGLGAAVLPCLAAAGVGEIHIIDADLVELSNLGRQTIYKTADIGQAKALRAQEYLQALNPSIHVFAHVAELNQANATQLIASVDLVIDCTDNFEARYLINDTCVRVGKPFVYAAIHAWEGLLSVCNVNNTGPTYRCLFPDEPQLGEIPTCNEAGVLGFLPGMLGLFQAKEAIFLLAGMDSPAQGALLRWDVQTMQMQRFAMKRTVNILPKAKTMPTELSAQAAADAYAKKEIDFMLDVREAFEWEMASINGAICMSMHALQIDAIPRDQVGLVICHHGMRSRQVIQFLGQQGFTNLINLTGGIDAWSREVDQTIPRY